MSPSAPPAEFLYEAAGLADPSLALVVVAALTLLSFSISIWVLTWTRAARRAGEQRTAAAHTSVPTREGPVTVTGTVSYADGADLALRVDITQEGREAYSSGEWSQTWTEKDRKIAVAPFELEMDGGERLRVEPTRNVLFTGAFTKKVLVDTYTRVRTAELEPGKRVWIDGHLVSEADTRHPEGYREVGRALVLRDSPKHRMRISDEPVEMPYRRLASRWWMLGGLLLLGSVGMQVSFIPFHLRTFHGETVGATVTGRTVDSDGDSLRHVVAVRFDDGASGWFPVERDHHTAFVTGMPLPVRRVRGSTSMTQAGPEPSLDWWHLLQCVLVSGGALIAVLVTRKSRPDEPEPPKLVEHEKGRIPVDV